MKRILLVAFAALSLSGCDMIAGWLGMDDRNANRTATKDRQRGGGGDGVISNLQPIGEPPPGQSEGPPGDPGENGPPGQPMPPQGPGGSTGEIDPSMLVGRWGDNGRCDQAIEFFANGTFRAANGGRGNWRLDGDRLTMFNGNRRVTLRLRSVTPQRVVAEDPNGNVGASIRC
ncbi:MAG: hypothetical protein AB7O91_07370 [Sphingomonas sp.]